jgi:hypothetical protein
MVNTLSSHEQVVGGMYHLDHLEDSSSLEPVVQKVAFWCFRLISDIFSPAVLFPISVLKISKKVTAWAIKNTIISMKKLVKEALAQHTPVQKPSIEQKLRIQQLNSKKKRVESSLSKENLRWKEAKEAALEVRKRLKEETSAALESEIKLENLVGKNKILLSQIETDGQILETLNKQAEFTKKELETTSKKLALLSRAIEQKLNIYISSIPEFSTNIPEFSTNIVEFLSVRIDNQEFESAQSAIENGELIYKQAHIVVQFLENILQQEDLDFFIKLTLERYLIDYKSAMTDLENSVKVTKKHYFERFDSTFSSQGRVLAN